MLPQLFSQRHNLRLTPGGLFYEHVLKSARTGLHSILDDYFSKGCLSAEHLSVNVNSGLGIREGILAEYKSVPHHASREFRRESVKSARLVQQKSILLNHKNSRCDDLKCLLKNNKIRVSVDLVF